MGDEPNRFAGSMRMADGSRVTLTPDQAEKLWKSAEAAKKARETAMPDGQSALNAMFEAYTRLKELGWNEAIYCPKDGSSFDVIEAGSTGIHRCHYEGEWPKGGWWIEDDGDLWPSRPILFRLDPEAEEARKKRMAEAAARFREERDTPSAMPDGRHG